MYTDSDLMSPCTTPLAWHASTARNSWYTTHAFSQSDRNGRVDSRSYTFVARCWRIRNAGAPRPRCTGRVPCSQCWNGSRFGCTSGGIAWKMSDSRSATPSRFSSGVRRM